ncbi:hypothetical protein Acr_04g0008290 [Actinidia rufa]|uniref:Uncharacterized protein n=1 Tax=Actinidia rufa TaxID=165716 RepID=A0A7J0EI00_9ERIC|nr:hypothetical protein Acr_04g0008290 [Actinidia rufa]
MTVTTGKRRKTGRQNQRGSEMERLVEVEARPQANQRRREALGVGGTGPKDTESAESPQGKGKSGGKRGRPSKL